MTGINNNPIAFMPSEYATHGNSEDFAETFKEVVTSTYFHLGDSTYLADARTVYNNTSLGFNHNIGTRSVVMKNIIDGLEHGGNDAFCKENYSHTNFAYRLPIFFR